MALSPPTLESGHGISPSSHQSNLQSATEPSEVLTPSMPTKSNSEERIELDPSVVGSSESLLPPSPMSEKATAGQTEANSSSESIFPSDPYSDILFAKPVFYSAPQKPEFEFGKMNEVISDFEQQVLSMPQANFFENKEALLNFKELKACQGLLKTLKKHPSAWPFLTPVDPVAAGAPNYFDIIKTPMDLGTIEKRLQLPHYPSVPAVLSDIQQVFDNCYIFNPPSHTIFSLATHLDKLLDTRVPKIWPTLRWRSVNSGISSTSTATNSSTELIMTASEIKDCKFIIKTIKLHHSAWPFLAPVDPVALGIPSYTEIVKNPMDFGTIEQRLHDTITHYKTTRQFLADVQLVFDNCYLFNPPNHSVCLLGRQVEKYLENQLMKVWPMAQWRGGSVLSAGGSGRAAAAVAAVAFKQEADFNDSDLKRSRTSSQSRQRTFSKSGQASSSNQNDNQAKNSFKSKRRKSDESILKTTQLLATAAAATIAGMVKTAKKRKRPTKEADSVRDSESDSSSSSSDSDSESDLTKMNNLLATFSNMQQATALKSSKKQKSSARSQATNNLNFTPTVKSCENCQKTETSMWRRGPSGLGTLCNGCGVKWSKNERQKQAAAQGQQTSSASTSAKNVPKASSSPITFEQKVELSDLIQHHLSAEHQSSVIEIIRSTSNVQSNEDEVELDMDALDSVSLRRLYDHVVSCVEQERKLALEKQKMTLKMAEQLQKNRND